MVLQCSSSSSSSKGAYISNPPTTAGGCLRDTRSPTLNSVSSCSHSDIYSGAGTIVKRKPHRVPNCCSGNLPSTTVAGPMSIPTSSTTASSTIISRKNATPATTSSKGSSQRNTSFMLSLPSTAIGVPEAAPTGLIAGTTTPICVPGSMPTSTVISVSETRQHTSSNSTNPMRNSTNGTSDDDEVLRRERWSWVKTNLNSILALLYSQYS
eukprot:Filipodium_phascolosomae@DN5800_c0_g1_i1.p1